MGNAVQAAAAQATRPGGGRAPHRGLALGLILAVQLLVVIDVSIVTLALPAIQRGLGFSPAGLQWVISAYALAFGGFLLLGGRLADLLGRRAILVTGAAVFTAGSLACGLAGSAGLLVAARAVEGLGAALMAPAALSLILVLFPEGPQRTKALGAVGAVSGAGGAIGVLAGGMLTTWLSWPLIFFVSLPVGALIMAGARPLLPESRAGLGHRRFDVAGAVTVTGGLSLLVYAVVTAAGHGWASATTAGLLAGAAALLAAFVVVEARSAAPLLPLSFFANRTVTAANLAGLLLGGVMFPTFVFLSLYMQQVLGYSPIRAGLAFLVTAAGIIASSGLAQHLVTRAGARPVLAAGLARLGRRPGAVHPAACPRELRRAPAARVLARGRRARPGRRRRPRRLRHRRQARRRGTCLGADQHQPADRRRDRPGGDHHHRRRPHRQPAARRAPGRGGADRRIPRRVRRHRRPRAGRSGGSDRSHPPCPRGRRGGRTARLPGPREGGPGPGPR